MKATNRLVIVATIALALTTMAGGCAYNPSSADVYSASQAQREETIRMGTVESVRGVKIQANDGQPTGIGALGGSALGAVAGGAIGSGWGSVAASVVGGIIGMVAGNAVENGVAIHDGVEITVKLDNGDLRAITQAASGETFQAGDRVRILSSGGVTRVTH